MNSHLHISSGLDVAAPGTGALRGRGYAAPMELGGLFAGA